MDNQLENRVRVCIAEILELSDQTQNTALAYATTKMFNTFSKDVLPQMAKSFGILAEQTEDKESKIKGKVVQYRRRV